MSKMAKMKMVNMGKMNKELIRQCLDVLSEIPEKKWSVGNFRTVNGRCCAIGHLQPPISSPGKSIGIDLLNAGAGWLMNVNDGYVLQYSQGNPKARVINYLCDLLEDKI